MTRNLHTNHPTHKYQEVNDRFIIKFMWSHNIISLQNWYVWLFCPMQFQEYSLFSFNSLYCFIQAYSLFFYWQQLYCANVNTFVSFCYVWLFTFSWNEFQNIILVSQVYFVCSFVSVLVFQDINLFLFFLSSSTLTKFFSIMCLI